LRNAPPWREVWIGADATPRSWLVYSGTTVVPFGGGGIHDDGARLRIASGYGEYRWLGRDATPTGERARGSGHVLFTDILAGYLKRFGPLTAKAFAGVALSHHDVTGLSLAGAPGLTPDEAPISGLDVGVKVGVELWLNVGDAGWSSLDVNWSDAHDVFSARWRGGYRVMPNVSLGLEAIANGDHRRDLGTVVDDPSLDGLNRRGGAFVRYDWTGGEVSLAGGASWRSDDGLEPYATATWIKQF